MIDDEDLRARLGEPLRRVAVPELRPARVARRARAIRTRRVIGGVAGALVLVAAIVVPLAALSGVHARPGPEPASAGSEFSVDGFELALPAGWNFQTGPHGATDLPVLYAANFPIPMKDGLVDTGAARDVMPPNGILIQVLDYTSICESRPPCAMNFPVARLPLTLTPDGLGDAVEGVPGSHDFERRTVTVNGRAFDLWVEFGTHPAPDALLAEANDVLATLRVMPTEFPGAYQGWTTHYDAQNGVVIDTPDAWGFNDDPVPNQLDPAILFAAGNQPPIPSGGECGPDAALKLFPSDGALMWLTEYRDPPNPADFPSRPDSISLGDLSAGPLECIGERTYVIMFSDQGRNFQFDVVLGPDASDATRRDVVTSLNTFSSVPDQSCVRSMETYTPAGLATFSTAAGAPGDKVTVSGLGPFPPRTEGGSHAWTDRVQVWWNDNDGGFPHVAAPSGPAVPLAAQDMSRTCAYSVTFTVPDVPTGTYPVSIRAYGGGGYSQWGAETFTVTG